jgi:hypothetical protein
MRWARKEEAKIKLRNSYVQPNIPKPHRETAGRDKHRDIFGRSGLLHGQCTRAGVVTVSHVQYVMRDN